jgi:cell division protein FtsQ
MMATPALTDKRFRRSHVSPARRRRRFNVSRKRIAQAIVCGVLLLYLGYRGVGVTTRALTVTHVTVSGNTRISRADVLRLLEGLHGRQILLVDLDDWRQKLLQSPWVADAAIRRVLPGTVDVIIAERQPTGIARVGHRLYLLDQRGGIIAEFGPDHAEFDLPLIDGLAAAGRGSRADPVLDLERAALAMRLLSTLKNRPDLAARVSQIDVTDRRDAVVILKGDTVLVRVGDDQFAERLQSYLDLAPVLRERVPRIDYVDLRFGERVYVRPQAAGPRRQTTGGG